MSTQKTLEAKGPNSVQMANSTSSCRLSHLLMSSSAFLSITFSNISIALPSFNLQIPAADEMAFFNQTLLYSVNDNYSPNRVININQKRPQKKMDAHLSHFICLPGFHSLLIPCNTEELKIFVQKKKKNTTETLAAPQPVIRSHVSGLILFKYTVGVN